MGTTGVSRGELSLAQPTTNHLNTYPGAWYGSDGRGGRGGPRDTLRVVIRVSVSALYA